MGCLTDQPIAFLIALRMHLSLGIALGLSVSGFAAPSYADTIWVTKTGMEERLCARDVIITDEGDGYVRYRRLYGSIVVRDSCSTTKGQAETLRVIKSSPEERRNILERWMKLGHVAEITDASGEKFTVFNVGLGYDAPAGLTLVCLGGCPAAQPSISIKRGERTSELNFEDLRSIRVQNDVITVVLKTGVELSGQLEGRTAGNTPLLAKFKGLEDLGTATPVDFELLVRQASVVVFKSGQQR